MSQPSFNPHNARESRATIRFAVVCGLSLAIAVLIEIALFNWQFVSSFFMEPYEGSPIISFEGGTCSAESGITLSQGNNSFTVDNIDGEIRNMRIALSPTFKDENGEDTLKTDVEQVRCDSIDITISLSDDGSANQSYVLPELEMDLDNAAEAYIDLFPAGECKSLTITIDNLDELGSTIVSGIAFNQHVPLKVSLKRLFGIFALLFSFALLCSRSPLSRAPVCNSRKMTVLILCLIAALQATALFLLAHSNSYYTLSHHDAFAENQTQYQMLAQSLLNGHASIDISPDEILLSLANPYDLSSRKASGAEYLWDFALFNGTYYVYFGILPCVIFYVPWLAITGSDLPNWIASASANACFSCASMFLLYQICRRWFPRTTFSSYILLDLGFLLGSGALICARTPTLYSIPIACGIALVSLGLALWIKAGSALSGRRKLALIATGSTCMALLLLTRPQLMAFTLAGIPLLTNRDEEAPNRKEPFLCPKSIAAVSVPFAIVGIAAGLYNEIRFGSPFDFGANYNLTTNDMRLRGFYLERLPLGFLAFLLQPLNIGSRWPFLNHTTIDPSYQGVTISETMYGGSLFLFPWLLILLATPFAWRLLRGQKLKALFTTTLVASLVICAFDIEGAGILMRYQCDFGLGLSLCSTLLWLSCLNRSAPQTQEDSEPVFSQEWHGGRAALQALVALSVIICICWWFAFGELWEGVK